ncbi:LuxR C-terminal-related transcriptional regulator [Streptomyces ipomoeae]|uniref:ATP-binding protein n=1 Tax=Streptomyces ipomoeae TaxID=103232 RepID=UPI00215C1C8E|nr:LuxR C-terminal-related transcriptional regulator [Streptomyces ipomoeae]MDX2821438.1 LuxR C-terminal-related transcriptional regulator [Streptomyces ipomoeae]MDX2873887.1 LuxR C-terminal-related transcriptional regulator [Streptomyces ipomoeae]
MTIQTSQIPGVGNLPAALTTFVGRRQDLAEVRGRLGATRLLTLTGVGGVGKTRLALEVAAASAPDFADGVWLVDLAAVRDPALVANATAAALGVPNLGVRPIVDQLAAFLTHRSPLIVLDNCEHLVDACAELAHALLSGSPGLSILTTSRRALGIFGEHIFAVPPLAPDDAVELLRDRTTAVRADFQVTDDNRAQVLRLCADLDGLPLAIELAASRLRTLTVDEAVNRLEDRFGLLTSGNRTARPHQRTLRALIDWSHELCAPAEQLLWHRLSVFAGDFGLDAAEAVCAGDGIERDEVLDLLDRLVVQSVVLPCEREGLPRYRLLETIRRYGRERLAASGEEQRMLGRHHAFYLTLAEGIADGWYGPGRQESLHRLHIERANLRAALDQGDDPQTILELATALRFHWCEGGFLGEGRHCLERALAAAPEPRPARARALWVAAWLAVLQRDHTAAHRWLDEAEALGGRLGNPVVCAYVQSLRGTLAIFDGRLDDAVSFFETALASHTETGEETGAVYALLQLGAAQSHLGDPRATPNCRRAVALAEAHGGQLVQAHTLWVLGHDAWMRGDHEEAIAVTRTALKKERGSDDYLWVALMLEQLALATAARGDHQEAARLLGAAHALWRDTDTTIATFGPHMVERHARGEEEILRALGTAAYEEALTEGGRHRCPDEAIAYALRAAPEPAAEAARPTAAAPAPSPLTPREREVAALVAEGMSNRQIATALGRSPRTIHGHVENILAKLEFNCRAQIASWWTANQAYTA